MGDCKQDKTADESYFVGTLDMLFQKESKNFKFYQLNITELEKKTGNHGCLTKYVGQLIFASPNTFIDPFRY